MFLGLRLRWVMVNFLIVFLSLWFLLCLWFFVAVELLVIHGGMRLARLMELEKTFGARGFSDGTEK